MDVCMLIRRVDVFFRTNAEEIDALICYGEEDYEPFVFNHMQIHYIAVIGDYIICLYSKGQVYYIRVCNMYHQLVGDFVHASESKLHIRKKFDITCGEVCAMIREQEYLELTYSGRSYRDCKLTDIHIRTCEFVCDTPVVDYMKLGEGAHKARRLQRKFEGGKNEQL